MITSRYVIRNYHIFTLLMLLLVLDFSGRLAYLVLFAVSFFKKYGTSGPGFTSYEDMIIVINNIAGDNAGSPIIYALIIFCLITICFSILIKFIDIYAKSGISMSQFVKIESKSDILLKALEPLGELAEKYKWKVNFFSSPMQKGKNAIACRRDGKNIFIYFSPNYLFSLLNGQNIKNAKFILFHEIGHLISYDTFFKRINTAMLVFFLLIEIFGVIYAFATTLNINDSSVIRLWNKVSIIPFLHGIILLPLLLIAYIQSNKNMESWANTFSQVKNNVLYDELTQSLNPSGGKGAHYSIEKQQKDIFTNYNNVIGYNPQIFILLGYLQINGMLSINELFLLPYIAYLAASVIFLLFFSVLSFYINRTDYPIKYMLSILGCYILGMILNYVEHAVVMHTVSNTFEIKRALLFASSLTLLFLLSLLALYITRKYKLHAILRVLLFTLIYCLFIILTPYSSANEKNPDDDKLVMFTGNAKVFRSAKQLLSLTELVTKSKYDDIANFASNKKVHALVDSKRFPLIIKPIYDGDVLLLKVIDNSEELFFRIRRLDTNSSEITYIFQLSMAMSSGKDTSYIYYIVRQSQLDPTTLKILDIRYNPKLSIKYSIHAKEDKWENIIPYQTLTGNQDNIINYLRESAKLN